MRQINLLLTMSALSGLYVLLLSNSNGRATGANSGNTGAPGEATTCGSCHTGGSFGMVTAQIQVFALGTTNTVAAYVPGTTYDMRVTITNGMGSPVGRGFQMTCLTVANNAPLAGYSNLASNVKQITLNSGPQSGRTYVEHNGVTANNQFNFRWTAPATGVGSVRFYAAGNAVNGNSSTSGDVSGNTNLILPQAQPIAASGVITHPLCFGQSNGSINQTVSAGVAPFTFLWSDGATTEDRSGLAAGGYSVTITDAAGQTFQTQYTLIEPAAITHGFSVVNATFPGGQGSVTLNASGGTGNLIIHITGVGEVSAFPVSLPAGSYSYQITDANECTANGSFSITSPQPLSVDVSVQNVSCAGANNGSLTLNSISGATGPYTAEWDAEVAGTNLGPSLYVLTVTDAVGYVQVFPFEITEPQPLVPVAQSGSIACHGQSTIVQVSATGGTGPYQGTGNFTLQAGPHFFTVIDAMGCQAETSLFLSQPEPLSVSALAPTLPCIDGQGEVSISAAGGTLPYSGVGIFEVANPGVYLYSVSDTNGCVSEVQVVVAALDGPSVETSVASPVCFGECSGQVALALTNAVEPVSAMWSTGSTDLSPDDLCSGLHSVTITDASGCVLVANVNVPEAIPLDLTFVFDSIPCFGGSTQVEAVPSGGTLPYDVTVLVGPDGPWTAGQYIVMVSDFSGCEYFESLNLTQPLPLTSEVALSNVLCYGGSTGAANALASGGTGDLTYQWSNGVVGNVNENLTAGTYTLQVFDENGCSGEFQYSVSQPDSLELLITDIAVTGNFAQIQIAAFGGVSPYNVQITNETGNVIPGPNLPVPGTYIITLTDANGCVEISEEILFDAGLGEMIQSHGWSIYPNPFESEFWIDADFEIGNWRVVDISGKMVAEGWTNQSRLKIQAAEWPSGLYLFRASSSESPSFIRIFKR